MLSGKKSVCKRDASETQTRGRRRRRSPFPEPGAFKWVRPWSLGPAKPSARPASRSETSTPSSFPHSLLRTSGPGFVEVRPAAAASGPGTAQTTARSPGPRGAGAGAVGPEQQRHARFRPARLRGRRGGPTIPFWLRGRAGRGGAGRAE